MSNHLFRSMFIGAITVLLCAGMGQRAFAEDESKPCNPDGQVLAYGDVLAGCTIEVITDLDAFQFTTSVSIA